MAINKVNVLGTVYDIGGGSGGGLTGYSGATTTTFTNCTFKGGLKEDGTYTTTFSVSDKYIFILILAGLNDISSIYNLEYGIVNQYQGQIVYYAIPTADNWHFRLSLSGGGSGA